MRAKAEAGDEAARMHVFLGDLELGRYSFAQGSLKLALMSAKMAPALREEAEQKLVDVQFRELSSELSNKLREGLPREEYTKLSNELSVDFFKAGRIPSGGDAMRLLMSVMRAADLDEDVELYAAAFERFKASAADQPRYANVLGRFEARLEELRGR